MMMKMKRDIAFKIIQNIFEPGNKNGCHVNFNNIMKDYRKYNCAMSNNGDDQKVANLKKCSLLYLQSKVDICVTWYC